MNQKYQKDFQLVQRILKREENALVEFHHLYSPKLFNYIKNKISINQDAEEVLQDSLFASLEALRDYAGQSSLYTYIYGITKHKVVDYYRRKKIKNIVFSKLPTVKDLVSNLLSPEQKYSERELIERINRCFSQMKPHYMKVLKLKYVEGFTVGQIAQLTQETIKGVESTLFRARKEFVRVFATV